MKGIKITEHKGFEINYSENDNVFVWENGEAPALSTVKAQIDKQLKNGFERFEAYYRDPYYSQKFKKVTVTSKVEKTERYSNQEYWIVDEKKNRSKVGEAYLYPVTPENEKLIGFIQEVDEEIESFKAEKEKLLKRLEPLKTEEKIDE